MADTWKSLWLLVRRDWRDRFPTPWAGLGDGITLALGLTLYWYTARAFGAGAGAGPGSAFGPAGAGDYFQFVVLGEAVLLLPLALVGGFLRALREAQADGTLEAFLVLPWSGSRTVAWLGMASAPRDAGRALLLLGAAALVFGFRLAPAACLPLLLAQLLAVPVAVAFGLATGAIFLRLGRGESALAFFAAAAAVLAGAYFPVTVFPAALCALAEALSPFNALLLISRAAAAGGWAGWGSHGGAVATLGAWGLLGLPLAGLALSRSLRAVRERGSVEVVR